MTTESDVHLWLPQAGGALHAFPRPSEAAFTDDLRKVTCDACKSAVVEARPGRPTAAPGRARHSDRGERPMTAESAPRPRPKCGHAPGHEAGKCTPTLDSYWASHLNEWVDMSTRSEGSAS